jgi:hypothetical protein
MCLQSWPLAGRVILLKVIGHFSDTWTIIKSMNYTDDHFDCIHYSDVFLVYLHFISCWGNNYELSKHRHNLTTHTWWREKVMNSENKRHRIMQDFRWRHCRNIDLWKNELIPSDSDSSDKQRESDDETDVHIVVLPPESSPLYHPVPLPPFTLKALCHLLTYFVPRILTSHWSD